jgi:hypothetical protein
MRNNASTLIALLCFFYGCAVVSSSTINNEVKLRQRIEQAYNCLKEKKYDKFLNYIEVAQSYDNTKKNNALRVLSLSPIIVEYIIKDIEINGETAKVRIKITFQIENKKTNEIKRGEEEYFDHWIFINNVWYLSDFSKEW